MPPRFLNLKIPRTFSILFRYSIAQIIVPYNILGFKTQWRRLENITTTGLRSTILLICWVIDCDSEYKILVAIALQSRLLISASEPISGMILVLEAIRLQTKLAIKKTNPRKIIPKILLNFTFEFS